MSIDKSILNNDLNDQVTYRAFFTALGYGEDEKIFLRTFKDKGTKDSGRKYQVDLGHFDSIIPTLKADNLKDRGIYFVVNGGGQSDKEVTTAKAQFIENDDLSFEDQIDKLNDFPLEPSIIIKTRNSLHCYWILADGDIQQFKNIQTRMIEYFNSDPVIKNESRVMRLYGFEHRKEDPIVVTLLKFDPTLIYTQDQLGAVLPISMTAPAKKKTATAKSQPTTTSRRTIYQSDVKQELRSRLLDYVNLITTPSPDGTKDFYCCPFCGSGTHRGDRSDGAFHVTGETWYCHACDRGGDIFTLYAEMDHLNTERDFPKIVDGLCQALGITVHSDWEDWCDWGDLIQDNQPKQTDTVADRDDQQPEQVSIPVKKDEEDEEEEINISRGVNSNYYFIVKGEDEKNSIMTAGAKNVIPSHDLETLRNVIESDVITIDGAVIIADYDLDESGAHALFEPFAEKNITAIMSYPPDGYHDVNELLKADPDKLKMLVKRWGLELIELMKPEQPEESKKRDKAVNVSKYLTENFFDQDIEYFKRYKDRKIGFGNIDKYMTLYPGVCCLGGASSLGKTTFAVNIVDNLLEKGESVIYIALEQLPIELITKSLARRMHYLDPASTLTNIDIKNGASSDALTRAKLEYIQTARNYTIVEGDFHVTVDHIVKYVEKYIEVTSVKPIVVIDYLQLIAPPDDFKGTQREIIDENLKVIKDMSKRNELFVLLISSFNRASYKEPVSMESFKESGMIEYTCDYILGLQLSILEDSSFYTSPGARGGEKDNNNDKKEKKLFDAMNQSPKEVELVVLKNRNGKQRFKCFFQYEMKYDTFTPDFNSKYDPESAKADFDNMVKSFEQMNLKKI